MIFLRVKICCIGSIEEARMAIEAGASALGLVSEMPSGPGVISEKLIAEIAAQIPPGVSSFLLTSRQNASEIIEQHRRCRTSTIQICDRLIHGDYGKLKSALPGIKIVQVIHVRGTDSVAEALSVSKEVDALLLDSGNQELKTKELGGTGRVHNWELSREIAEKSSAPVYLAGGLNASNVLEAISKVRPFGIDLCSGVRTGGKLDKDKLEKFFSAVLSYRV